VEEEISCSWLPSIHPSLRSRSLLTFSSPRSSRSLSPPPHFSVAPLSFRSSLICLSLRFALLFLSLALALALALARSLALSLWRRSECRERGRHHQCPRWRLLTNMRVCVCVCVYMCVCVCVCVSEQRISFSITRMCSLNRRFS